MRRRKILKISLILILQITLIIFAINTTRSYWETNQVATQEFTKLETQLTADGYYVLRHSLDDFQSSYRKNENVVVRIYEISDETSFLNYLKPENNRTILADVKEQSLYFSFSPEENATSIIVYRRVQPAIILDLWVFSSLLGIFDLGGLASFFIASSILIFFLLYHTIKEKENGSNSSKPNTEWLIFTKSSTVSFLVILTGVIGIWLAVRTFLLVVTNALLQEGFLYTSAEIFTLIGIIVAANLPFTLYTALTKTAESGERALIGLIDVVLQAIIIGFVTLVPSYAQITLLSKIGGYQGFVAILVALVLTLLILVIARSRLEKMRIANTV